MEKIPDSDRELGKYEALDKVIDKINEIIDWINDQ
tara:strand:+ start:464 stop:568 length:105 start_codon:yes stop_codon:yes gene_type:complete